MGAPTCIECGCVAHLVGGERIYPHRPDLYAKSFWLCECGAYCGCHPGTTAALGYPCGPGTRKARSAAHEAFDRLWKTGVMKRDKAYKWLSQATGISHERCHIGMMTAAEARRVVAVSQAFKTHTCKKCGRIFASSAALGMHHRDKHRSQANHGLSANLAIEMADAMDLPDGAYFAMIGDLMGGDYMDGIDAVISEGCE